MLDQDTELHAQSPKMTRPYYEVRKQLKAGAALLCNVLRKRESALDSIS